MEVCHFHLKFSVSKINSHEPVFVGSKDVKLTNENMHLKGLKSQFRAIFSTTLLSMGTT